MDIRALHEFIAFSKNLNVTKCAEELNMAPSSLSRHLSAMERELGIELVAHKGTRLSLTAAGQMVLDASSAITARYDGLLDKIELLKNSEFGDIHVGYALDDRTSIDALSIAFATLRPRLPGVAVRADRIQEKTIFGALEKGAIDLAVLYELKGVDPQVFESRPFWRDSILIALPKNEANAGRTSVRPEEVMNCKLPWPSAARDNYLDRAMRMFDGCPARPTILWIDADNMDTFFMHVLDEREIWFLSKNHRDRYLGSIPACFANSIVPCEVAGVDSTVTRYAVWRRDNPNRAVAMLAEELARGLRE